MPVHIHPTASCAARAAAGRPRARAAARPVLPRAEDVQPQPRAVGLHGDGRRRRAADDPGHRDGRAERGDRARGAVRPRAAAAIRVGTCGALDGRPRARRARRRRGGDRRSTARAARSAPASASRRSPRSTRRCAPPPARARAGAVVTTDLFYDRDPRARARGRRAGALAVEMEAATLLRVAELRGIAVGLPAGRHRHLRRRARRRIDADGLVARPSSSGAWPPPRSALRSRRAARRIRRLSLRPSSAPGRRDRLGRRAAPRAARRARAVSVATWPRSPPGAPRAGAGGIASTAARRGGRCRPRCPPGAGDERTRRVSRSMSAAVGMLSAPKAPPAPRRLLARVERARSAPLTKGLASRSSASRPSVSSLCG